MAKAKTIVRRQDSEIESGYTKAAVQEELSLIERIKLRKETKSRAEKLAGDFELIMKWQFPEAREVFPNEPWMRHVDKYFPYALGGALLIDEPMLPEIIERCKRKKIILQELGYRYLFLTPEMNEAEMYMELEKCGQTPPQQSQT